MDEFGYSSAARRRAQMDRQRKAAARREADLKAVLGIGVLILIFLWSIAYMIWLPQTHRTVTATVYKTWVSCRSGNEDCKNLIGTDAGVFEDSDSLLYWKWNSSDYFSNMLPGHSYTFEVVGWRMPWASEYPNIIKMDRETE